MGMCVGRGAGSGAAPARPERLGLRRHPQGYGRRMALRWYTIVVDCHDIGAQAQWWADVLGWKKIYEADDEVVLVARLGHGGVGQGDTVGTGSVQGLVFVSVPEGKTVKNRLHIDLAPHTSDDRDAEIARLLSMGATRVNVGQTGDESWDVLADPEGNEFCVLSSRDF